MWVDVIKTNKPLQANTKPMLDEPGYMWRINRGTILSPFLDKDGWYGENPPKLTVWMEDRTRPFFSFRVPIWPGKHLRGYIGWKIYGIIDHYVRNWLHPMHLGGQAMFFSMRLSLIDSDKKQG